MKKNYPGNYPALIAVILTVWGCTTTKPPEVEPEPPPPDAPEVQAATELYDQGLVQDAITATIDITRKNPGARGLASLQSKLADYLAEERNQAALEHAQSTIKAASADATRFGVMPDTYRSQRHVVGETGSLKSLPAAMQQVLQAPVSVNLQNASLNGFIAQFANSTNINIIADSNLGAMPATEDGESESSAKKITIKAENTPLIEILDYVGRNLGVTFSVGENIIWATARDESETILPMETRVYKLRKGMTGSELGKSVAGLTPFKGAVSSRDPTRNDAPTQDKQESKEEGIALNEIIREFVPQPEGAKITFSEKAHVLIVKNTREHLAKVEEIIEALDIRPLQILIEARFITTKITDLSDLGIDWLLDNRGPARFVGGSSGGSGAVDAEGNAIDQSYATSIDDVWLRGAELATKVRPDVLIATAGKRGGTLAYQAILGDTALQATLHALRKDGQSKAIFVPRVTTLNNREATVRIGEDTTYYDDVDVQSTTSTGYGASTGYHDVQMRYNTPARLETGCTLVVTPSVGADLSTINLMLRPEISDAIDWKEYVLSTTSYKDQKTGNETQPTIKIPTVSRQYIETETVVRSGETVVLGGLVRTHKQESSTKTPFLHRLPLIGGLFRVETKEDDVENILIFVTATLIADTGEGLIPLTEMERYGSIVPEASRTPLILQDRKLAPPDAIPNAPNMPLPIKLPPPEPKAAEENQVKPLLIEPPAQTGEAVKEP